MPWSPSNLATKCAITSACPGNGRRRRLRHEESHRKNIGEGRISMTNEKVLEVSGNVADARCSHLKRQLIDCVEYRASHCTGGSRPLHHCPRRLNKFSCFRSAAGQFVCSLRNDGATPFSWCHGATPPIRPQLNNCVRLGVIYTIDVALHGHQTKQKINALSCVSDDAWAGSRLAGTRENESRT